MMKEPLRTNDGAEQNSSSRKNNTEQQQTTPIVRFTSLLLSDGLFK